MRYILLMILAGCLQSAGCPTPVPEPLQAVFRYHGSIIMAVKCSDGIIMVADSRVFYQAPPPDNTLLAYEDGLPKIFPLKKFALAIAGDMSDGETRIQKIVTDFDRSGATYSTPDECLYKFGLFTRDKYPNYFKSLDKNIVLAAGYSPAATLAVLVHNETYVISDKNWTSNLSSELDSLHLFGSSVLSRCKPVADTAEAAMKAYIRMAHKENEMGGLFSVLKIRPDNSYTWQKNDFTGNGFLTECEASKAYYNKKIKLHFPDPGNKKLMDGLNNIIWLKCITKRH